MTELSQRSRSEQDMVAYALEVDAGLLPFIPELLADFAELGSDADDIVEVLRPLALGPNTRVVDLGSGKGAVALRIADELRWSVVGIELFAPFVESARQQAIAQHLGDLCEFVHGDVSKIGQWLAQSSSESWVVAVSPPVTSASLALLSNVLFDVAIFAALGDVLGSFKETMAVIRKFVRPGGYILISDGFILDDSINEVTSPGHYGTRETMLREMTAWGDQLVEEVIFSDDDDDGDETADEAELIRQRAEELALRHPEMKLALQDFAASQAAEYDRLSRHFGDAIWVFRRN